jgi:hypothetical protein
MVEGASGAKAPRAARARHCGENRRSDREYDDGMRKPPMTFDAILAALAVLSTTAACSRAEHAGAEPASATPTTTATATATATMAPGPAGSAAPPAEPPAAPTAAPSPTPTAAAFVDAGTERAPNAKPKPGGKGASAACGATGCSAEMRKGGK